MIDVSKAYAIGPCRRCDRRAYRLDLGRTGSVSGTIAEYEAEDSIAANAAQNGRMAETAASKGKGSEPGNMILS